MSRLSYTDYDFNRLVIQLQNRLSATETWKDAYRSSTGTMLIELFAYVANMALYYVERRAEESYLNTAQLKSSVINLVKLLGYNPKRKVSSSGVVRFTLAAAKEHNVILPQYTQIRTASGLNFLLKQGALIEKGLTTIDTEAIQGTISQTITAASGSTEQMYTISDVNIENDNLFVYVNGVLWEQVDSFSAYNNTSTVYKLRTESSEYVTILFGDNVFGQAPSEGSSLLFKYIKTEGIGGNVYSLGAINSIYDNIYDTEGTLITDITVANTSTFTGGTESEDIEAIRYNAPRVFKTGDRLVTKDDFEAFLLSETTSPRIVEAKVWGENEENAPNYNMFNTLKICALKSDWSGLNVIDKQNLSVDLYAKSLMTVKYEFVDATIIEIVPTLNVVIHRGFTKSQAELNIYAILVEQFELGITSKLGEAKRLSTIVSALKTLSEISYFQLVLEIRKVLTRDFDSFYLFSGTVDAMDIQRDSVKIYLGETDSTATLIAHTDFNGDFVADSSLFTAGEIVWEYGYVGIDAVATADESLWIRYQQDNSTVEQEGDVVVDNDQICRLFEDQADITSIKYTDEV